jgi:hypothetical protein
VRAGQTAAWKACGWWNTVLVDAPHTVAFDQLSGCDLVLDRVYKGGNAGNAADDPLARLLPGVGNQGGFRAMGKAARDAVRLVVLYTSGAEPDWPDELDPYTGAFTYFGDNRSPGRELHDTPRKGNLLLRTVFERAHSGPDGRTKVPPFLLFDKPGTGRDVRFRGLLAPGSDRISGEEDLVAVWRTTKGQRFQNYRARFSHPQCGTRRLCRLGVAVHEHKPPVSGSIQWTVLRPARQAHADAVRGAGRSRASCRFQPGSRATLHAAITWSTACWCSRLAAPCPERQVAHT